MAEIKVQEMELEKLVPYKNNPRYNDKAVDAVAESIRQFGFRNPIIVDRDLVIISGHTRRLAAIKLGLKMVPVYVADDMSEQQKRAFRLADNRVAELATWDKDLLKQEIADIMDVDLSSFGFEQEDIKQVRSEMLGIKMHRCPKCGHEWRS